MVPPRAPSFRSPFASLSGRRQSRHPRRRTHVDQSRSRRDPRTRRDGDRRRRGGDRACRRDRRRGDRPWAGARRHPRVPRPRVRVAVPPEGAAHVRRRGRPRATDRRRRRRRGPERRRVGRRPRLDDPRRQRHPPPDRKEAHVRNSDLLIAANTVWVVVAAVLVMFMQAGFAFLEAGLTRMKNAAHIAGKNVLIFGICSLVYWAIGFGIAFGDGNGLFGTTGFLPSTDAFLSVGKAPFTWFSEIPGAAGYLFEVVFAGVALAIVWGAMAERAKLWVCFVFGAFFTVLYSVVSHWIWHSGGWLFSLGMQDFAGSTVVHYQGALAALAGALLLGPRIGKFGHDGRANPIPGHNMPYAVLGTLILWFGWFGFNPGSTLAVVTGHHIGYFGYVALTTNVAAAAGALGGIATAWVVLKKPDVSMMLNGVIAALVAITAASGFVAPWAAIVIGFLAAVIAVVAVPLVERIGIDDPIGAVAVHGLAGVWGTLATGLFAVPALASNLATGRGGLVYTGSFHQVGVQALGLVAVGGFTFTASFGCLWTLKRLWGIRVEEHVETAGLDVSEHGMWGYPEFYIPVPGGYGTEAHGHLGAPHMHRPAPAQEPAPVPAQPAEEAA